MMEFIKRNMARNGDIFFVSSEFARAAGQGGHGGAGARGLREIAHPDYPGDDAVDGGQQMLQSMKQLVRPLTAVCREVVDRCNKGDGAGNRVNINFVALNQSKTHKKVEINKNAPTLHQHRHVHRHSATDRNRQDRRSTNSNRKSAANSNSKRERKRVFQETNSSPFAGTNRARKRQKTSSNTADQKKGWKQSMCDW